MFFLVVMNEICYYVLLKSSRRTGGAPCLRNLFPRTLGKARIIATATGLLDPAEARAAEQEVLDPI
jgi:hypothetical protein